MSKAIRLTHIEHGIHYRKHEFGVGSRGLDLGVLPIILMEVVCRIEPIIERLIAGNIVGELPYPVSGKLGADEHLHIVLDLLKLADYFEPLSCNGIFLIRIISSPAASAALTISATIISGLAQREKCVWIWVLYFASSSIS